MKISSLIHKFYLCSLLIAIALAGSLFSVNPVKAAASPCTADYFHSGLISANETWCAGATHYITDTVIVQAGVTLTIAAGVTVDSPEADWSKYLIIQGHLDINGTLAQPVLLTRSVNYPIQNWGGLFFDGSQGDGSGTLNYATIDHAGANFLPPGCAGACGNGQTAVFAKDLAAGKQLTINNSTIHDNTSKGLYVVDSTVNVTNTTFSENKYPILIDGAASVVTYSGNTFSNNAYPYYDNMNYTIQEDAIFINPDALTGHDFNLPVQNGLEAYVLWGNTTIPAGTTMSVNPGVTLRKDWGNYLTVKGHLQAVGTQALPIHFTGIPASVTGNTLYWGGLYFDGSAGDGSGNLAYTSIESGGSNSLPPGCTGTCGTAQTALFVKDIPATKQVNISYSVIQNSLGKGVFVVNSSSTHLENMLIKGGRFGADLVSNLSVSNLAVTDMLLDGIVVESGYSLDARHLTIARAGRSGLHVTNGATGLLKNSILSQNALAVWAEGNGQASLDTNLSDMNTTFKSGTVTELNTLTGSAVFEADGYHIQTGSAAVGRGLAGLGVSVDIDGGARPSPAGSLPDLGADEVITGGNTFADVPVAHWAWQYIEILVKNGITSGCSDNPKQYCPGGTVTRDQMAIFLLRAEHGASYTPPAPKGIFADVPVTHWAAGWIEQLAAEKITSGCGASPKRYCPDSPVTRDQMATFLLRAEHGSSYVPPTATGIFTDVPVSYWNANWIERLAFEGITSGCSSTPKMYCPAQAVARDQMAIFLVRAFGLK